MLAPHTPISHINWEIVINIEKLSPTPKKWPPILIPHNTDAPDAANNDSVDAPHSADDYAAYTKPIHLSLHNRNRNRKIPPITKKQ